MKIITALKEAERFMEYFAGETDNVFVGSGTPKECLAQIRAALAAPWEPLKWETYAGSKSVGEQREYYGYHEFGYYIVTKDVTPERQYWHLSTFTNRGQARHIGSFPNLKAAKETAQCDFEACAALTFDT